MIFWFRLEEQKQADHQRAEHLAARVCSRLNVRGFVSVLLLQVGDELLFVVQLVSQAADLLLVSFTVRVDLLLHRFLDTQKSAVSFLLLNLTLPDKKVVSRESNWDSGQHPKGPKCV